MDIQERIKWIQNRMSEYQDELESLKKEEELKAEEKRLLEELEKVRTQLKALKYKKQDKSTYRMEKEDDVMTELRDKDYVEFTSFTGKKYYATTDGDFYSETKKIKKTLQKNGYEYVVIDGGAKLAHRVLWEVFNGEIPAGMEIDHINTIKTDNRIENLRLVTSSENKRNPLTIEKYKVSNKNKGIVRQRSENN